MKSKERHKLARTTVDVYRLFKVWDIASLLRNSTDPIVRASAGQIVAETASMLDVYCKKQQAIIQQDTAKKAKKAK